MSESTFKDDNSQQNTAATDSLDLLVELMGYPTKVCNMCGKTFDFWDHQRDFCFDRKIGYGSAHDFEHMQLNLCCQCFDNVIDWILPQCRHNPMTAYQKEMIRVNKPFHKESLL